MTGAPSEPASRRTTFCRLCEPNCGLIATLGAAGHVEISGDPDNPHSAGFLCNKARAMSDIQSDPDRVLRPLRRVGKPGEFEPVGWEEALDEIGERLRAAVEAHGSSCVGVYSGNPRAFSFAHDSAVRCFVRGLDTPHLYGPMSQDGGSRLAATAILYGSPALMLIPDLPRTELLLIIGANPLVSNGSMTSTPGIRGELGAIVKRGGRVVVVDPRRSETARAFEHIPIRPGADAWLLLGILHVLFAEERVDRAFIERSTEDVDQLAGVVARYPPALCGSQSGVSAETIVELARAIAGARTAAVYGRTGTCTQAHGTLVNVLQDLVNIVTGNLDRAGGWVFGSSPLGFEERMRRAGSDTYGRIRSRIGNLPDVIGYLPAAVLSAEIETPGPGQIRVLMTTAGNPALSAPDPRALTRALAQLELHFSLDLYVTETNKHADFILPSTTFLERSDVNLMGCISHRPYIQATRAVLAPAGEAREEWGVISELARRMGCPEAALPLPPEESIDLLLRDGLGISLRELEDRPHGMLLRKAPETGVLEHKLAHPRKRIPLADSRVLGELRALDSERLAGDARSDFPLRMIGLRETRSLNSWMHNARSLVGDRHPARLHIHPSDADAHGLRSGSLAQLESRVGAISVVIHVSAEMNPGCVAYPHGWGHDGGWRRANDAGGANPNALVSSAPGDLEPLAAMSVLNGIPVRLHREVES